MAPDRSLSGHKHSSIKGKSTDWHVCSLQTLIDWRDSHHLSSEWQCSHGHSTKKLVPSLGFTIGIIQRLEWWLTFIKIGLSIGIVTSNNGVARVCSSKTTFQVTSFHWAFRTFRLRTLTKSHHAHPTKISGHYPVLQSPLLQRIHPMSHWSVWLRNNTSKYLQHWSVRGNANCGSCLAWGWHCHHSKLLAKGRDPTCNLTAQHSLQSPSLPS